MANDIFSRQTSSLGGVFTADRAKLTFAEGLRALVQQMSMVYSQTISRLYEVGSPNIYYIGGRTQGQMTINRVVGPKVTICGVYQRYGDVCRARENVITLSLTETDCSTTSASDTTTTFTMLNCVITQVGVSVAAQDMVINDNTTLMYSTLECQAG